MLKIFLFLIFFMFLCNYVKCLVIILFFFLINYQSSNIAFYLNHFKSTIYYFNFITVIKTNKKKETLLLFILINRLSNY